MNGHLSAIATSLKQPVYPESAVLLNISLDIVAISLQTSFFYCPWMAVVDRLHLFSISYTYGYLFCNSSAISGMLTKFLLL